MFHRTRGGKDVEESKLWGVEEAGCGKRRAIVAAAAAAIQRTRREAVGLS